MLWHIGLLCFIYVSSHLLWQLYNRFVRAEYNWSKYAGTYALVTGGSEGIGLGYCHALAKRGINIIMLSRSQEKLEKAAVSVRRSAPKGVAVIPIAFDISQSSDAFDSLINDRLAQYNITILINNAGGITSEGVGARFNTVSHEFHWKTIYLNVHSVTKLCHLLLPIFLSKNKKEASSSSSSPPYVVINVSSLSAALGMPLISSYAASKACVIALTRALHSEYLEDNIRFECHVPGNVTSASNRAPTSFDTPSSMDWSECSIHQFGWSIVCVPHFVQYIESKFMFSLPEWLALSFLKNTVAKMTPVITSKPKSI